MISFRSTCRSLAHGSFNRALLMLLLAGVWLGLPPAASTQELGSARLQIAGTRLVVTPATQTVPLEASTVVETHLEGYDPDLGVLPGDLRVVADFTGPGLESGLRLEAFPNEPLRVPALRTKGEYFLENIRLVQGDELLTYAEPRTASVLATQILISSVSTRALTEDEIRNYGIVIGDDSRQAVNLTFAFGFEGEEIEYSMPVVFRHFGPEDWGQPAVMELPEFVGRTVSTARFQPPRPVPFKVELDRTEFLEEPKSPWGGCPFDAEPCRQMLPPEPPMVGVVFFPAEMSLLHQFFSVVLMVQNGAPDGDVLTISDLTARIQVPSGLRQASTEPPTPLGVPVPVRVPGPDGEVGTSDDLTLLVAQATGQAEFLVEGLEQGTHIVEFDMEGRLHGLPEGPRRITGKAQGAVTVRDPTLSASISHPTVVRENTPYSTFFTVTNLGNQPVNGIQISLPTSGLSGTRLADGEVNTKDLGSLLPGESASAEFEMVALLSGKLAATSTRAGSGVSPLFEFSVGVENGIPLSPETLALPASVDVLPEELLVPAQRMLGLAHSLSTAPWELVQDKPQVTRGDVDERAYRLVEAGRVYGLGEPLFETSAFLLAEWCGARDGSWEWDELRRLSDPALEFAEYVGATMLVTEPDADTALDRFAGTIFGFEPWLAMSTYGEIEVSSRVSGKSSSGFLSEAVRDLPFAELLPLGDAELAMVTRPEEEGHRVTVRRSASGGVDLRVVLPSDDGSDMRSISWQAVSLDAGGSAWVDVVNDGSTLQLQVDGDADGVAEYQIPGTEVALAPRPFEAVAAVQNQDIDPSGHVIDVLFTRDLGLGSLIPRDPERFQVEGRVSNGGITPSEQSVGGGILGIPVTENPFLGLSNPRIVRVVFNNPMGPLESHEITIGDLQSALGESLVSQTMPVQITLEQAGVRLEGTVIDSYGQPLPGALVTLYESDKSGIGRYAECSEHATAVTQADAQGRYEFGYVRQTDCTDVFRVKAVAPGEPRWGEAEGRVRFVGQTQELDVVMLGRAIVEGRVTYEDGSAPEGLRVTAFNHVQNEGRAAWTDEDGNYRMAEVTVGTVQLAAWDSLGNRVFQTIEVPTAGARIERDLTLIRRQEDLSSGTVRGNVVRHSTSEAISGALVALYVDEQLIGWRETDWEGAFDFGLVPTGLVELQAFDGLTGLEAAQIFTELEPDQVIDQELRLTNDRGQVAGRVQRQLSDGSIIPVADAIVYVDGLPESTRSGADGTYRLEDIPFGNHSVKAVDLPANERATARVTVDSASADALADIYFSDPDIQLPTSLTGTVLDRQGSPVSGATVRLAEGYWSVRYAHSTTTDSQGKFRFDSVPTGLHAVHAHKQDDGGIAWGELRFQGDSDDVTVQFAGGTLEGRTFYKDSDGLKVPVVSTLYYRHVEVVDYYGLVAVSDNWKQLVTEADGTFAVPVLNGPWEIIVHNAFHGSKRASGFFDAFSEEVEFELDRNGSISGTVFLEDGETPAAWADVTLRGGQISGFTVQADENGQFFFDLLKKGRYELTANLDQGALFRTQRIWADLRESGDEVDVEIVLPKQGTVEGWVEDADGLPVAGAVVELKERGYPWRKIRQTTDGEGNYYFQNIFEGQVTLTAQAPSLGGLGATGGAELTDEGQEVLTLLTLEGVGTVSGTIFSPATGDVVANARVRIEIPGGVGKPFVSSTNSELDGTFEFKQLPFGFYRVKVFDPTTGRHGLGETVEVTHHGQIVQADVTLEVRGIVDGHIYDPPSNDPVPGATIRLDSWGIKWFRTYSSAGVDGYFSFEGIPEGEFRLRAKVDGRRASNSGEIVEEDQVVTRDLYLEALGTIFGVVLGPRDIDGVPGPPMTNVNVTVQRWQSIVAATTENPFLVDRILPGRVTVKVEEAGEIREARSDINVEEGGEHEVELVMPAIGSATVQVTSSIGEPIPFTQVKLTNRTDIGRNTYQKTADDNGWVAFEDVVEGTVSISATDPTTGLRGTANAELTYEGEALALDVFLEPTATVRGTVLLSDGVTPGEGVIVAIRLGSSPWQTIEADESGFFEFTPLRLQSFSLEANDPYGPGSFSTSGALDTDQEIQEFNLVLDDEDPFVVSMTPTSMSRDLPLDTQVSLRFNEPLVPCSSCGQWFAFERVQGGYVPFNVVWSEGDTVATLVPTQSLASATTYRVRVKNRAKDPAGRIVDPLFSGGFTTADVVPPSVIDLDPLPGAVQVPVDSTITIQFSEPVDVATLSGAFQVTDLTTGQPITVTTLVRLDDTGVVLTPVQDFELDRHIEVRVSGVADPAGNVQPSPFVMTFWTPDATAPGIEWIEPSALQTFTAGELIDFQARVTDNQGTARVRFELDEWTSPWLDAQVDPGPPDQSTEEIFSAQLPAPIRATAGDVVLRTVAEDIWGNQSVAEQTIRVEPLVNQSAPAFMATCPADLDFVAPGVPLTTTVSATDDLGIESVWLEVDGELMDTVAPVIVAESTVGLSWTPSVDAVPGQTFGLQFFVRDFAGNVTSRQLTAQVPSVPVISAGESFVGSQLYLAAGDHVSAGDLAVDEVVLLDGASWIVGATDLLSATSKVEIQCGGVAELAKVDAPTVRVERGSVLRTPRIEPTDILAALFEVEEGGLVDGVGRGFYGVHTSGALPEMPTGVEAPVDGAGASHGGLGTNRQALSNQGVYGSVYVPHWSGTGGGEVSLSSGSGAYGGGTLRVRADQVVVEGRIDVRGTDQAEFTNRLGAAGAGGSVFIDTALLSGSGRINARGGDGADGGHQRGAGGGGRIAIHAGGLQGFDPALQAIARGGAIGGLRPGGPGTVYLTTPDLQGGVLWLRNVTESGDVLDLGVVELPPLGSGDVSASQVEGADRWVFAAAEFDTAWLGAWMRLEGSGGVDLGTFRVIEVDGIRVLLEGAAGVSSASSYHGVYLFDELHTVSADLRSADELRIEGAVTLDGESEYRQPLEAGSVSVAAGAEIKMFAPWTVAGDVVIGSGAVLRPDDRESVQITAGGRLELKTGALIDVDGKGYYIYEAPPGLEPDPDNLGSGTHGGLAESQTQIDVYDSVYLPNLPGGGAGHNNGYTLKHGLGGGVVVLQAAEMVIDGDITARNGPSEYVIGAGGTIRLQTQQLSGIGSLDASASENETDAGGGRIAVWADQIDGFDPIAQTRTSSAGMGTDVRNYGAAGTLFVKTASSTYGRLILDNETQDDGSPRRTATPTSLPALGEGSPTAVTAEGLDLRLDLGTLALQRWAGAYVELFDTADALLGEFRVSELDGTTILVEEAGGLAGQVASYRGIYRFDRIDVLNGAQLDWPDATPVDELIFGSDTVVSGPVEARTIRLTSGAVLRPSGRHPIELKADESIVIEEGAVIDVTGMGFEGFSNYGTAPSGIAPAGNDSGGSHGGRALGGAAGEVYGSVYYPYQSGGAGSSYGHGGGAILIHAPNVQLDGALLALGDPDGYEGAGGSVLLQAGQLSGTGWIDASAPDDSYYVAGGGGRVALLVDSLVGFDPATQVVAAGPRRFGSQPAEHAAAGTIFVRTTDSIFGDLRIDNRRLDERDPVDDIVRKAFQTELPALGEGSPVSASADGADLLLDLGQEARPRWLRAWIELLDSADAPLGLFEVSALEGNSLRVQGAATHAGEVSTYRGTYRFDSVDVRGGAGLQAFDPARGEVIRLAGDADLGGPWTADQYVVKSGAVVRPVEFEPLVLEADASVTIEAGATVSALGRSLYDLNQRAPDNVDGGTSYSGNHGGFSLGANGELYGSVYFPQFGGGSGGGSSRGGGVIRIDAPSVQIDGLVDVAPLPERYSRRAAPGTVVVETDHLAGSGQILAQGLEGTGGGRIAVYVRQMMSFDPAVQLSAAGGYGNLSSRGGVGTVYVYGPNSTWGDLLLDNEQFGLSHQQNEPYTYLPRLGTGEVGLAEADAADPANLWVEPAAAGVVFDLGVEGMWFRSGGSDYRILAEDGSRRRILLEGAAGLVDVGDSYSGLYRFDSVIVENSSYLRVDDATEVGTWNISSDSAVEASSLAIDVEITSLDPGTEGAAYSLTATFSDQELGQSHSATIDWGDGSTEAGVVADGDTGSVTGTHVWPQDGSYLVEVCVSDLDGRDGCGQATVAIEEVAPVLTVPGVETYEGWQQEDSPFFVHFERLGNWRLSSSTPGTVVNSLTRGSVFYSAEEGTHWEWTGQWKHPSSSVASGLVFGFQEGDAIGQAETDYLSLTWSTGAYDLVPGLRLYRIREATAFWAFDEPTTELVAEASTLANWSPSAETRDLKVRKTEARLEIYIDDVLEFDVVLESVGAMGAGFGVWSHQSDVQFLSMTKQKKVVEEGLPLEIDGFSYTDVGVLDAHTATVDWGDGSPIEAAVVVEADGAGEVQTPQHVYATSGSYSATICVSDETSESCESIPVEVTNLAPRVAGNAQTMDLGSAPTVEAATFVDTVPGVHTATIDWGDGAGPESATVEVTSPGEGRVLVTPPQQVGQWLADVCVTDEGGATACDVFDLTVEGANAPVVLSVAAAGDEGSDATLSATFSDADAGEVHTATVDWGSGPVAATVDQDTDTVTGSFSFAENGDYPITVCVTDEAALEHCLAGTATISNAAPVVGFDTGVVNLEDWTVEELEQTHGPGAWTVSADGTSVTQSNNSSSSFFYGGDSVEGWRVQATARTPGDNDAFGFALGFSAGDTGPNSTIDYLHVEWRQAVQSGLPRGLRLYRMTGPDLWDGTAARELIALGATLGDAPWAANRDYEFEIEVFPGHLRLWVDGSLEIDTEVQFTSGGLALWARAQVVTFSDVQRLGQVAFEGSSLQVTDAGFMDVGVEDSHTATVDWGDGSSSESAAVSGGSVFGASHVYADDGSYAVNVCVLDDDGGEGCGTINVSVVNVAPVVTSAGSVALDGISEVELATYTDVGLGDAHTATIDWGDGSSSAGTVEVTGAGQGRVLGDHDYATGGVFTVQVCVVDDSAGSGCTTVDVSSADSVPPTVSVSGVNPTYSAGETLTATIDTVDEVGVERVEVTFDGSLTTLTEGGPTFTFTTQVDPNLTAPRDTTLDVVAYDFSGNASTTFSQTVHLGVDLPPDLTLTATPERADGRYTSGEPVTFVAEATDNVVVASLEIDVDGDVTGGSSPVTVNWTAPSVAQATAVVVTATAIDDAGNTSVETLNLQVDPLANGVPPEVAFTCLSDGATLPSAYDLPLQLIATDDVGVAQVDLYLDDETTPFATAVPDEGGTLSFDVNEVLTLPTVTGAPHTVRIRAVASDASFNSAEEEVTIDVVETTDLATDGTNDWTALASRVGVLRSGTLELSQPRSLGGLIVLNGAVVTHPQAAPGAETALDLTVGGPVYVGCGSSINATAKGYPRGATHPDATMPGNGGGGQHIGRGGYYSGAIGTTYGSVYFPRESGSGGENSGYGSAGGGVVHLAAAGDVQIDGEIRADGEQRTGSWRRAGAGGSIWIDADGTVGGLGTFSAQGSTGTSGTGSGGGGAIAIYHGGLANGLQARLLSYGGGVHPEGGAGSIYLSGPTSTFGDLVIDAGAVADGITDLPSLGAGVAQAGSAGTILETGLGSVQDYFVGHWIEIQDASGLLEGTFRVMSISGGSVTLGSGASVDPGDSWQGVYRFDNVDLVGDIELRSDDPIRVSGEQVIDGSLETERIEAGALVLRSSATLTHPATTDPAHPQRLVIELSGDLTLEAGSKIDVTAKGYPRGATHPGETMPGDGSGGHHIGRGGHYGGAIGTTYGSVYFPLEPGSGGEHAGYGMSGGGVVYIAAGGSVQVDGEILADAEQRTGTSRRAGAGGSIWIDAAGTVGGAGTLSAQGSRSTNSTGSGGGGAIAIYHGGLSGLLGGLESRLFSRGGDLQIEGGAGSVYLSGPASTYGDLVIDAGTVLDGITDLPSLGSGVAQAGSSGSVLATELSSVQTYFLGHWIEIYDGAGDLEGTFRIAEINGGTLTLSSGASVDPGDTWQGVYRFDNVDLLGDIELTSDDPIRVSGEQVIDGFLETEQITGHDLVLRSGATLTHPATTDPASPQRLVIELSGDLTLEAGSTIDVTAKGYPRGATHPGEVMPGGGSGGHHIGRGGHYGGAVGTTYGSLYFPLEPGSGGEHSGYGSVGGGVVSIFAGGNVQIDGLIRADGEQRTSSYRRGGAGGSIWIDAAGTVGGSGTLSAQGSRGTNNVGSGGGGAIAIYHGGPSGLTGGLESRLVSRSGDAQIEGGAGSIYLSGSTSTYGDLVIDAGAVPDGITDLPSLGSGVAQAGSSGTLLETDLGSVQAFFEGHWIEIHDGSGLLEGTFRVTEINGGLLTLSVGASVDPGDTWQGVYLFDNLDLLGEIDLRSADPIRVSGEQVIDGFLETEQITGHDLVLRSGATLTHPATTDPANPQRLVIELSGDLTLEAGSTIDVTAKGYPRGATHPGEVMPGDGSGGHHIGRGGHYGGVIGTTYGSVYFPLEPGSGGEHSGYGMAGGGVVYIAAAGDVQVDGEILADAEQRTGTSRRAGAGGSIWIDAAGTVGGAGTLSAQGSRSTNSIGSGGGGAIAIYHGGPSGLTDGLESRVVSRGGDLQIEGGAGSVYLSGPTSTYGDLVLDAGPVLDGITDLPSLGSGVAQAGSSGTVLETGLGSVQRYFTGHWVEIHDSSGSLEGTWRVVTIDGGTLTLESGASVDAGDSWQGVYRFDTLEVVGEVDLRSLDPIRVVGQQVIDGLVELESITGHDLVLRAGSTLTHPATTDPANPKRLKVELSGDLTLEVGSKIDVTAKGYPRGATHPGEVMPGDGSGGHHIGRGGHYGGVIGTTYGSVYFPLEPGSGGEHSGYGMSGGGVVYIAAAGDVQVDGEILADAEQRTGTSRRAGAGGSIWIDAAGTVGGAGTLSAQGSRSTNSIGSGGGGAIAIHHGGLIGDLDSRLLAFGGDLGREGGAGSIYLHGPTSTYGDLIVDNADILGDWTVLPALGAGTAQASSAADTLVTDLATAIQPYFVGHWVEIYDGTTEAFEGTYRVAEILPDGLTVVLAPNGVDTPSVDPGDLWQGVYLFDDVLLTGDALGVTSDDPIIATGTQTIRGAVTTERVMGGHLILDTDALLTHPPEDGASRGLDIRLTGDLTVGSGAAIDVSGQGYRYNTTHSTASAPGSGGGGSHLGLGGYLPGTSYGSVVRPWQHGGGGEHSSAGGRGGGRIRLEANHLVFTDATGAILANGVPTSHSSARGGAGGSIWIDLTGQLQGDGALEAIGGEAASYHGSGGGGAISITHQGSTGTALGGAAAWGGDHTDIGGAGTIFVHGPASTDGDLIVRSAGTAGRDTVLPALGQGTAGIGSSGSTLVTGLATAAPDYFVGHFVEISTSGGSVTGTFPIESIEGGTTLILGDQDGIPPSVNEGDTWRGVYRFDTVTVEDATLSSSDGIFESGTEIVP